MAKYGYKILACEVIPGHSKGIFAVGGTASPTFRTARAGKSHAKVYTTSDDHTWSMLGIFMNVNIDTFDRGDRRIRSAASDDSILYIYTQISHQPRGLTSSELSHMVRQRPGTDPGTSPIV